MAKLKIPNRLLSRKLWCAIVASFVAFGNSYWKWNLTPDQVFEIMLPLLAYLGVEGIADIAERNK